MDWTGFKDAISSLGSRLALAVAQLDRQRVSLRSTSILAHKVLTQPGFEVLYTVGKNKRTEVTEILLANVQASESDVRIAIVPNGSESVSDGDIFFPGITLGENDRERLELTTALVEGWSIWAYASTPHVVNVHISGSEMIN